MAGGYRIENTNRFPITVPDATETSDGVMSSEDKTKLDGIPPGGTGILFNAPNAAVVVGSAVYESASNTVDLAIASAIATVSIGVVVSKPTATTALVAPLGEVAAFVGLVPTTTYYLSSTIAGTLTATPPSTVGQVSQRVGYAKNSTTLVVDRGPSVIL